MSGFTGPINTLPAGLAPQGTDIVPTWQGSGNSPYTRQVTWFDLFGALIPDVGVVTPGSTASVTNNVAVFSDTTGKVIQDGSVPIARVVQGPTTSVAGDIPTFSGTSGNVVVDSGILATSLAVRTPLGTTADWLTPLINWPVPSSYMCQLSPDSRMAITGASQTADGVSTAFPAAIGISGFGFNNLAGGASQYTAWGGYFEGRQYPGVTANTFGVEIEVANVSGVDSQTATPYSFVPSPTWGLFIGSGAGVQEDTPALTAHTATAALVINANISNFQSGIIFAHDSLAGTVGDGTGTANAINLATGHVVQWWQNSTTAGGYIYSAQTSGPSTGIRFENARVEIDSDSVLGSPVAAFANTPPAPGTTTFELLVSNTAGVTFVGVTLGDPDSGGTGKRALVVPN